MAALSSSGTGESKAAKPASSRDVSMLTDEQATFPRLQIAKFNDDPVFVWTNAVNDTWSIESIQVPLDSFVLNQ